MRRPIQPPTPDRLPAYCPRCGDAVTGWHRASDVPFVYRHNVFKLYAGTCTRCSNSESAPYHGGPYRAAKESRNSPADIAYWSG